MDCLLRINMGSPGGPAVSRNGMDGYAGLGGRGLTSALIAREVPPLCHPLGPENKLIIAPGLLSGTSAAMSGRLSIGCKSPLTGTIKESNAGGQPAQVLARLGYGAVVLEGVPAGDDLYKIVIDRDGARIEIDNSLKGLPNYDLIEKMKARYGDGICCLSIGPAGEMRMGAASIACTDMELRPTRHAGRGGVGAVMGSKRVKVIILDDGKMATREPANPAEFRRANKLFIEGLRSHPVTGEALPAYGTNVLANVINEAGAYPTRNFRQGRFEGVSKISGEYQAELEKNRGGSATHGCHRGCTIRCSGIYVDKNGRYVTKQPEYETVWAHGANCGIDDLDTIAMLDFLDDNYGVDTIETGVSIALAMEAGIIPFGDGAGAIDLIHQVGKGTPLGRILGNGAEVTARCFGLDRVPVVKGQALPAYDPRAIQGIGVTYATSTMGADHTAGYAIATNILKVGGFVDPLKTEGQIELSRNLQVATAAVDSTGMCLFIAFAVLDQPETFQALIDMINAFYGLSMTGEDVANLGKRILEIERDFNRRAGFNGEHDRLPRFFYKQPLEPHGTTFMVHHEDLDKVHSG